MPELRMVPIKDIKVGVRFRENLGDLGELAASIRLKGVLQPITLNTNLELQAGGRRLNAAAMAGLNEIPALLRHSEDIIDAREVELMENVIRKDFDWPERAKITQEIDKLYREKNTDWSVRKTASLLDKGLGSVSREIQLANAIEIMPELADLDTADEALKIVKKMEETAIVGELRSRQVAALAAPGLKKGIDLMLQMADKHYRIGDTFKGLVELPSNCAGVNIIECDPPYGIDLTELKASKDNVASNVHSYNEIDKGEYPQFLTKLTKELYRVAHTHCWLIFWFGPTWQNEVLLALRAAEWKVDEIPCVWIKNQGQTMQPEMYLGRAYEPFYLCRKGTPVIMKRGRLNVFEFPGTPGSKKYHPTERPVPLIQELFETLGVPRQSVLVPFLGSGATLRAAYNCGMIGFGWDTNPEYKDKFMLAVEEDSRALGGNDDVSQS